jgi:hypothetical protein
MRILARILMGLVALVLVVVVGAGLWPPELIRVANAYSAKMVCSNVYLAKRGVQDVLAVDVQAPGHPILKYVQVTEASGDTIAASLLGVFGTEYAVYRPGLGCASVPGHDLDNARKAAFTTR